MNLYNYALVNKFLVVNRVNVFAIYLLVIEGCFAQFKLKSRRIISAFFC